MTSQAAQLPLRASCSLYYINNNIKKFSALFRRFLHIVFRRFLNIFENSPKTVRSSYEHFRSENFRRLPKVAEYFRAILIVIMTSLISSYVKLTNLCNVFTAREILVIH